MVSNNNNLIIENKKAPIEEVGEMDHQVPSYEEFMKNYEYDGKVNYEDLDNRNVGEGKGYGPGPSFSIPTYPDHLDCGIRDIIDNPVRRAVNEQ